jgi:hypothetical protein
LRPGDFVKQEREQLEARCATAKGGMTFRDALEMYTYKQQLDGNPAPKPSAKLYRQKCIGSLLNSWPGLLETDLRKVSERDCLRWAAKFGQDYSPSVYNIGSFPRVRWRLEDRLCTDPVGPVTRQELRPLSRLPIRCRPRTRTLTLWFGVTSCLQSILSKLTQSPEQIVMVRRAISETLLRRVEESWRLIQVLTGA